MRSIADILTFRRRDLILFTNPKPFHLISIAENVSPAIFSPIPIKSCVSPKRGSFDFVPRADRD